MPLVTDSLKNLAYGLIVCALLITALVLGREILIPLALGTVIAFILAPIVSQATRIGIPRGAASGVVVAVAVLCLGAIAATFSAQLITLAGDFSQYRENIVRKVRFVTGAGTEGSLSRASATLDSLEKELKKELGPKAPSTGSSQKPEPQVVIAKDQPQSEIPYLGRITPFAGPLTIAGLTVLFTIFLLAQYNDLRDRVIRLAGTDNIGMTSAALTEAGERLSHLFTVQAALNICFGVFVGIALAIIGVPNPVMWGIATAILRFIPYIGSLIAAIPPTILAAGVDPGWAMTIATLGVFVIGEPIVGHIIEPLLLGRSVGVSPLAFIAAASFWTLMWGPVGLILAAPLTMLLVVLGQYIPQLEFLSVLLGDEPALAAEEEFYHRLLAGDAAAALPHIDDVVADRQLAAAGDKVVLPALKLAARDHRAQRIDDEQVATLRTTIDEVLDLVDAPETSSRATDAAADARPIVIVPARGVIDEISAHFVARVLQSATEQKVISVDKSSGLMALSSLRSNAKDVSPSVLVIATVGGMDGVYLKHIQTRASREFPGSQILTLSLADCAIKSGDGYKGQIVSTSSLRDIAAMAASSRKAAPEPGAAAVRGVPPVPKSKVSLATPA